MSAAVDEMEQIVEPGVYLGLDESTYHADPVDGGSLSVSGAKVLLDCPAKFAWQREHPSAPTTAFSIGHAAHALVLGVGAEIVVVDADSWRTKDAKAERDEAFTAGKIPLLTADYEMVEAMAARLRSSEVPSLLLSGSGQAEASLFLRDSSGVMLRGRVDWLPAPTPQMIVADYKTAASADPGDFAKAVANYGYHQQAAWYSDLIVGLGLAESVAFLFVVQEKDPPFEVTVCQLDATDLAIGRYLNLQAVERFVKCTETGVWPGYGDQVHLVGTPGWYRRQFEGIELEGASW
jgi:hypothetical protein